MDVSLSGYRQHSRLFQFLSKVGGRYLASTLMRAIAASLVSFLSETKISLRTGHCHKCDHISLSLWHKMQFQSGSYMSGLLLVCNKCKRGSSSNMSLAEKATIIDFANDVEERAVSL